MRTSSGLARAHLTVLCCILLSLAASGCVTTMQVTTGDAVRVIGELMDVPGDPLAKEKIMYQVSGKPQYDDFFQSVAHLRAGLILSKVFTTHITSTLKGLARSYVAAKQMDLSVKKLLGDIKPEDITADLSVALLVLKQKKEGLTIDERNFALKSAVNTGLIATYMATSVNESKALVQTGTSISKTVQNDFTGLDALKAPAVARSMTESVKNAKQVTSEAPTFVKEVVRLALVLKGLK